MFDRLSRLQKHAIIGFVLGVLTVILVVAIR